MKMERLRQGECDGPGQPHHEDAGRYVQGYNAQVVVTGGGTDHRADEVTQEANDFQQLHPMVERVQANLKAIAHRQTVEPALADASYCSEANLTDPDPARPTMLIAPNKDWKQRKVLRE
jgi:hypothetical protein